jgi:hypothetical protein
MRRPLVLAAGTILALTAAFAQALGGPLPARACSCIHPLPTMARVVSENPASVVLVGTIGRQQAERTPVAVEAWYHGPGVTDLVGLNFGNQGMTSCDPFVTAGEKRLMVLHRNEDGSFGVNPCVASGVIGTEAGNAALEEAEALFAAPQPPPTAPPSEPPTAPTEPAGAADLGWVMVASVLGVALLLFVAVALVAVRRRQPD